MNTATKAGIAAVIVGGLAFFLWPKKAEASAPSAPGAPSTPGTPPMPNTYVPPPAQNTIPTPSLPSTAPPATTTQPVAPALSALVALWEYRNGAWVEIADTKMGVGDLFSSTGINLAALFAALPQYKPNPPPYQYFRVFTSDGTQWTQVATAGLTKNY